MSTKLLFISNTSWYLWNFRRRLAEHLIENGFEIVFVAPRDDYSERLAAIGRFVSLEIDGKGRNPLKELYLVTRFAKLFRRERPAIVLTWTPKPNIYGAAVGRMLGIPVIPNVAGLGFAFIGVGLLPRIVGMLYRFAFQSSPIVFFQNEDDRKLFIENDLIRKDKSVRLPGSGVNLRHFSMDAKDMHPRSLLENEDKEKFRFILVARMLWDKGVGEYVKAARAIREQYLHAEFCLLGFLDGQNPSAISSVQMDQWVADEDVNYLGVTDDIRMQLAEANCVVLPSYYREGVPRILLEAAAMGRPIITTDAVGCRDVVDDGVNGYLCQPRDEMDLAEKMERMLLLSDEDRYTMGRRGREKVEKEFDENIVIGCYDEIISKIVN